MRKDLADFGRFSDPALLILTSLAAGPKHGYTMIEDIARFSGTHLEPGTLYGALTRLEARGWVAPLDPQERRRPYCLTDLGVRALSAQLGTMGRIVSTGLARLPAGRPSACGAGA